jgi:hypothetical protein
MAKSWMDDIPDDVWGGDAKPATTAIGTGMVTAPKSSSTSVGMGNPKTYYDQGMRAIGEMAAGTSPIFQNLENRAGQQFGGAAMATMGAAKQEGAQAGLTQEGIGSVAQTTARNLSGERSKMMGEIASQKQSLANTAATQLVSGGLSGMGQQLAERQQTQAEKATAEAQKQTDWERMLTTYDPSTPEGLKSLQTAYTSMFGGVAPDLNTMTEQRNYARTKQQQDVQMGGIGVTQAEQTTLDQQQGSIMSRIASGYSVDRINKELGTDLTPEEYAQMRQNTDTYFTSKGIDMQEATLYGYTDENGNRIAGSLEISAGQFDLQGKTFEEQKKEMWGWTDEDGVKHAGRYDLLSDENKRAADAAYGYDTTDALGNKVHVMGTLELANSADAINRQGLNLTEAQIKGYVDTKTGQWVKGSVQIAAERAGQEVSSLYGYYYDQETGEVISDPSEISRRSTELQHVDGALSLSAKSFGLNEKTVELQRRELEGYTDETTGEVVKGRMGILNAEDQRAAQQLYGYTDETTGKHIAGSLEIMGDELAIKKQGLTLDEAQLFGYEKDGKHVSGSLEIEADKLDIIRDEAQRQQDSEAGTALANYFGTMKNVAGWNPKTDKQADKLLQAYWEASGNTGMYDTSWADNQYAATTISQTDAALAGLEKEKWYQELVISDPKQAKQIKQVAELAAMLSVTQGAVPVYGEKGNIIGLNDSQGNQIWTIPEEASTVAATKVSVDRGTTGYKFASTSQETTAWNTLQKDADKYGITVDRQEWEKSGYPTIEAYKTGVSGLNALNVGNYSELLSINNSKKLFEVLKNDPTALKKSDYYLELPDTKYLSSNVTQETDNKNRRSTTLSSAFKITMDESLGKIIGFKITDPLGSTAKMGTSITGQLVSYLETPKAVGFTLKMPDGKNQSYYFDDDGTIGKA